jgi:ribosomal protein S17
MKPAGEFRTSAMGDYVCAGCQSLDALMSAFSALEDEEARLQDEYSDCASEVERMEVRAKLREVERKMADFDWGVHGKVVHELKLVQPYYDAVSEGRKTFEVRQNDRNFSEGDRVILHEYIPESKTYTGRNIVREITYVLDDPTYVKEGFVIFGIA